VFGSAKSDSNNERTHTAVLRLNTTMTGAEGRIELGAAPRSVPVVLPLDDFARQVTTVQPPFAYRLSLDSGVEFNNVKNAFDKPLAVRLDTLLRLLHSLGVVLVAAESVEDVASPGAEPTRIVIGTKPPGFVAASRIGSLSERRRALGVGTSAMASRVGVSIDTLLSIERGRGLVRNVARVCSELGLQLYVALPPQHHSVQELWAARADAYLTAPAQYPLRRPTRSRVAAGSYEGGEEPVGPETLPPRKMPFEGN
jgi:DNA-binding XRE family transcriptional regulator